MAGLVSLVVSLIVVAIASGFASGEIQRVPVFDSACRRSSKSECRKLPLEEGQTMPTCFGTPLQYSETSNELVNPNYTDHQMKTELEKWENGLRNLPRCWAVVQPLLCSFYMPKCVNGTIELPPQDLCKIARNPCRVVNESLKQWPDFLKCDDTEKFAPNCKNTEIQKLRFNTTGRCPKPLIPVESSSDNYDGFEGCALSCRDHSFSEAEHRMVSDLIRWCGVITLLMSGWVCLTYSMDWRSGGKWPAVSIFYANVSYFIATMGWMSQFFLNAKDDIACRKDGTLRRSGSDPNENAFGYVVFVLIYTGSIASLVCLVVFAHASNEVFRAVGRLQERIDKRRIYYKLVILFVPIVLMVISLSTSAVEGNYLTGICYITSEFNWQKTVLGLCPVLFGGSLLLFYVGKATYKLFKLTMDPSDFIPVQKKQKLKSKGNRYLVFMFGSAVCIFGSIAIQAYELSMRDVWAKSKRDNLICNLNFTNPAECTVEEKPSVQLVIVNVLLYFAGGVFVASWAFTKASCRTWKRRFSSSKESDDPALNPPKHELVAQAYGQRRDLAKGGNLTLNMKKVHEDPIGLNRLLDPNQLCKSINDIEAYQGNTGTELNSDINSDWAAAMPRLIERRNAVQPPISNTVSYASQDDSRRPSFDSATSEMASRHGTPSLGSRRRGLFGLGRKNRKWGWRRSHNGSCSSLESNQGSQIYPAVKAMIEHERLFGRGDDDNLVPLNNHRNERTTTTICKESAIQTSFERLPFLRGAERSSGRNCNHSNNLMVDKATQSSIVSLHEIGTQTKKSATKKKDKKEKTKVLGNEVEVNHVEPGPSDDVRGQQRENPEDAVLKLLTPN